jgi:hypothetical protein
MCIVTDPKIDIPNFKLNIIIKHMEFTAQCCIYWLNTDTRKSKVTDTSYYYDDEKHEPYYCHQEISVQLIISDASTILLTYFPPYLSSRILNLPLPLCTIFASNSASSTNRKHQQECFFSSFDIVVDSIIPKSFATLKEPSLTYELVP